MSRSMTVDPSGPPLGSYRLCMPLDRRTLLSRTSWQCVVELGFEGTTVAEIAHRAGCTPRTFWNHFSDREQAVVEAVLPDQLAAALFPVVSVESEQNPDVHELLEPWERAAMTVSRRGELARLHDLGALAARDRSLAPVVARSWEKLIRAAQVAASASGVDGDIIVGTAVAAALATAVTGPIDRGAFSHRRQDALDERISGCFLALRRIAR